MLLRSTRTGHLPAALVDPVDEAGVTAPGLWLIRDVAGTEYYQTEPLRSPARARTRPGARAAKPLTERRVPVEPVGGTGHGAKSGSAGTLDPLTGLPGRNHLMRRLERVRIGWVGPGSAVLLVVNLDRLSQVNHGLGHEAGDAVLVHAAQQIVEVTRDEDTVARLGGDEFLVLCENTDEYAGRIIADRIVRAIRQPVRHDGRELHVTASVGIAPVSGSTRSVDALRGAGAAVHRAKERGRNQAALFDREHATRLLSRFDLEQALNRAAKHNEFVLHFQTIHHVLDGTVQGAEALVRWNRPGHGLVQPEEFVPVAEQIGLMPALGTWVIDEALRQLSVWREAALVPADFTVSVNLSPVQLTDAGVVDTTLGALSAHGLVPGDLTLEMTETSVLADDSLTHDVVHALAAAGIALAIDDFGTGHSSLARLRYLPARQLKLDRSFIAGLPGGGPDAAIVAAVIGLAHEVGMTCVAEGVESADQLEHLRRLGCDLAQGYFLGRPVPAAELERSWGPRRA